MTASNKVTEFIKSYGRMTFVCVCVCARIHSCACEKVCVCVCVQMHSCICVHACVFVGKFIHASTVCEEKCVCVYLCVPV